jgi:predicted pyridoxine 5'-phosphate oxidase superfamily flavin-nucleotide-binding protein
MQGVLPGMIATCSGDGTPNMIHVSQVFYVDPTHVALSFQFFSKTARNIAENPYAEIRCMDPDTGDRWILQGRFVRRETDGPLFDQMDMQLEAVASMTGMTGVFKLRGADIYEVLDIQRVAMAPPT